MEHSLERCHINDQIVLHYKRTKGMAPLSLKSIVLTTFSYVEDYKVSLQHGLILNRVFPGLVHHEEEENEEEK